MFKQLNEFCEKYNLKNEFIVDETQQQNILKYIEPSWVCCSEGCDGGTNTRFHKHKINRCYIKVFFN